VSGIRDLLTLAGIGAAIVVVAPTLDLSATSGDPAPRTTSSRTTSAAPAGKCSDYVADSPSCAAQVAARGGCDVYTMGKDGKPHLASWTEPDGTRVDVLGVDTWTEPDGCDPERYQP
jgi:hypothetical protein